MELTKRGYEDWCNVDEVKNVSEEGTACYQVPYDVSFIISCCVGVDDAEPLFLLLSLLYTREHGMIISGVTSVLNHS